MILSEELTDPQKVQLPNQPPQTARLKFIIFKLDNDKDAKALGKIFAEPTDIVAVIPAGSISYLYLRQIIPSKLEL